jgi:hypothetical protein
VEILAVGEKIGMELVVMDMLLLIMKNLAILWLSSLARSLHKVKHLFTVINATLTLRTIYSEII